MEKEFRTKFLHGLCRQFDKKQWIGRSGVLAAMLILTACTQHHALNTRVTENGAFYGASTNDIEPVYLGQNNRTDQLPFYALPNAECQPGNTSYPNPLALANPKNISAVMAHARVVGNDDFLAFYNAALPLSPGDMLELSLLNGEGFEGDYIINPDGFIHIPHIDPIKAAGISADKLAEQIELALVRAGLFMNNQARAGIRVLHWAEIEVSVAGAVFQSGRVSINRKTPEQDLERRVAAFGDYAPTRMLSEALRAASGVRPDADLTRIVLIRNGWQTEVNLTGVVTGLAVNDIALVAGDQIVVPSTGCFQQALVKPSQITPKGFRVFLSNLTETAQSNSNAAVGRFSSNLPYGARLLQAAVSANCVGGTSWTNAPRKVLLASRNPLTGKTDVIERSIEHLVRQAHNDQMNPYLMPNDAVACYDSDATNLRDIGRTLADIFSPLSLL